MKELSNFEKAQADKILSCYSNTVDDLEKGGVGSGKKQFSIYGKGTYLSSSASGSKKPEWNHPEHGKWIDHSDTKEEAEILAKKYKNAEEYSPGYKRGNTYTVHKS